MLKSTYSNSWYFLKCLILVSAVTVHGVTGTIFSLLFSLLHWNHLVPEVSLVHGTGHCRYMLAL